MSRVLCMAALLLGFWAPMNATVNAETSSSPSCSEPSEKDVRTNINTASADELGKLPSIGPSRARAIIEARAERLFRRPEDIMRVHGIGRKTFRQLRNCIRVE